jgi:hypothetical protein
MNHDEPQMFDALGTVVAFARRSDMATSHEAATAVSPVVRRVRLAVLRFAESCGNAGFTDHQMNDYFDGHATSTYRTRRRELVDLGMIEDTGARVKLPSSGRHHAVWRITWKGLDQLQDVPRPQAA